MASRSTRGVWLVGGIFLLGLLALGGLFLVAGTVGSVRQLPHGYRLERGNGQYRVVGPGEGAASVFDGSIAQIGWDDRFVLAAVTKPGRDPQWFALDTIMRQVRGPIPDQELAVDPVLSRIPRQKSAIVARRISPAKAAPVGP